jgi:hypothetical protein
MADILCRETMYSYLRRPLSMKSVDAFLRYINYHSTTTPEETIHEYVYCYINELCSDPEITMDILQKLLDTYPRIGINGHAVSSLHTRRKHEILHTLEAQNRFNRAGKDMYVDSVQGIQS